MPTEPAAPPENPGSALAAGRKADLKLCLRYCTSEGIVAMPIVTMALPASMALSALVTKAYPVSAASLHLLSWVALGVFLPWIPRGDPRGAALWILGWFLVSSCFGAVAGVTWSTWIEEWVPRRIRARFFGRRNQILQFSAVVFLVASGWILSRWD